MVVRETTTAEDVEERGERVFITEHLGAEILVRVSWRRDVGAYDEAPQPVLQPPQTVA